jgi:hypothetical protein
MTSAESPHAEGPEGIPMLTTDTPDVDICGNGSTILFTPLSGEARAWFAEHVHSEPWQWVAGGLAVDRRLADDLMAGLHNAGFTVGD